MTYSPYAGELPAREKIPNAYVAEQAQAAERHLRFATARLGLRLAPGAKILDFGCGIGSSVRILLAQGYDAFGVDVLEYWDRDFDKYWHIEDKPPAEIAARLKRVDPANYRLPFADASFDFCFSDQVFEHVFDYRTTMSEIARRPPGLSTRNASARTRSLSADRLTTQFEMITSTELSGRGIFSISPFRNSTFVAPARALFAFANASISSVMSRP